MPRVGNKHYSYSAPGRAAAKQEAKRTGQPVKNASPPRRSGGSKKK